MPAKNHAEILASRPLDERKLTYQIDNQKECLYYRIYIRCDSNQIADHI